MLKALPSAFFPSIPTIAVAGFSNVYFGAMKNAHKITRTIAGHLPFVNSRAVKDWVKPYVSIKPLNTAAWLIAKPNGRIPQQAIQAIPSGKCTLDLLTPNSSQMESIIGNTIAKHTAGLVRILVRRIARMITPR